MYRKAPTKNSLRSNAVLEGLDKSDAVSAAVKSQLQGEALFVRAFAHFMANLFDAIPIIVYDNRI